MRLDENVRPRTDETPDLQLWLTLMAAVFTIVLSMTVLYSAATIRAAIDRNTDALNAQSREVTCRVLESQVEARLPQVSLRGCEELARGR